MMLTVESGYGQARRFERIETASAYPHNPACLAPQGYVQLQAHEQQPSTRQPSVRGSQEAVDAAELAHRHLAHLRAAAAYYHTIPLSIEEQ